MKQKRLQENLQYDLKIYVVEVSQRTRTPKEPVTAIQPQSPAPENPPVTSESEPAVVEEPERRGRKGRTPKKLADYVTSTKPSERRSPSPAKPKKGKKEEVEKEKPSQNDDEGTPVVQHEDIHLASDVEIDSVKGGSTTEEGAPEEAEKVFM